MLSRVALLACWAFAGHVSARAVSRAEGEPAAVDADVGEDQNAIDPCRRVAQAQALGYTFVKPSEALECLHAIPVDVERDSALIDYIYPLLSFESNLAWVKDPPMEYIASSGSFGVDILGGLLDIKKKVESNGYKSQYEFSLALEELVDAAMDGHFKLRTRLGGIFTFARDARMISVSPDGISLPDVYEVNDYVASIDAKYDPSPIVTLDGMDIYEYLDNLTVKVGGTHDLDAGFNMLFPSQAKLQTGLRIADYFSMGTYRELPDESSFQLANGTVYEFQNVAVFAADLTGIRAAADIHRRFEIPQPGFFKRDLEERQFPGMPGVPSQPVCRQPHGDADRPAHWPKPFDEHFDKYLGGFWLDGEEYKDVGVMELGSFGSLYLPGNDGACVAWDMNEYHRFMKSFVTKFKESGKKKLVIDMSMNGGGYETTLADTFDQLFPGQVPGFHYRVRATPELNWIISSTMGSRNDGVRDLLNDLQADYPESFGPVPMHGDNFTEMIFRNCLEERRDMGISDNVYTEPLLDPKDIVIITDGDCHSSCALLTGWLTREMGVKVVTFGGRPTEAPMQGIGGTKGGAVYPWENFQLYTLMGMIEKNIDESPSGLDLPSVNVPPLMVADQSINTMDIWHNGSVPVHFTWEAANCRLFYTADTFLHIESMWKAAVDVAWNGAKCAPGSTANADGTISDKTPSFKAPLLASRSMEKRSPKKVDGRVAADVRRLKSRPDSEWKELTAPGHARWIDLPHKRDPVIMAPRLASLGPKLKEAEPKLKSLGVELEALGFTEGS